MVGLNVQIEVHMIDKSKSKMLIPILLAMPTPFAPAGQYASIYPFFYRLKPAYFFSFKLPEWTTVSIILLDNASD